MSTITELPDAQAFRNYLKRLVAKGEHAKALLDMDAGEGIIKPVASEENYFPQIHRNGTDKMLPTVKRNCDAAYEILTVAARPLQRDDLLERMKSAGKTSLTKGTSLAYYLRQDKKRFKTAGKGLWKAIPTKEAVH